MLLSLLALFSCKESPRVLQFPYSQMQEGDLAFRCGLGVFSRAVTSVEDEGRYSHVGILVNNDGQWNVVHAVPGETEFPGDFERVKEESIEVFYSPKRAYSGCLVHTGVDDTVALRSICATAIQFARDSVLFDDKYDMYDSSKVYCTELVWRLYQSIGIDLSEGRSRYFNVLHIHNDCLLPEHLLAYRNNDIYFNF